jgi:Ca2+-binding EF-hand superfamily protein
MSEYAKWVMQNYDSDKDGYLNSEEVKKLLEKAVGSDVTDTQVTTWINKYD